MVTVLLMGRGPGRPAGVGPGSRAEALRWAVGQIRENPACVQVQQRVSEINELKTQA